MWNKRRRTGFRQKPWNKPTRAEKFWTTAPEMFNNNSYLLSGTGTAALYVAGLDGQQLAGDANTSVTIRAAQHVKLHRFQGYIWAWLDPQVSSDTDGRPTEETWGTGTGGDFGHPLRPNIQMLSYAWFKLKEDADVAGINAVGQAVTHFNPRPGQDLANMLLRDDLITWGQMPIWGIDPRMYTREYFAAATSVASLIAGHSGMDSVGRVARIPFPRLPKAGLNLRKGEALMCAVAMFGGPGGYVTDPADPDEVLRDAVIFPQYRMLCSI